MCCTNSAQVGGQVGPDGTQSTPCPLCRAPIRASEVVEMPAAAAAVVNDDEKISAESESIAFSRIGSSSKVRSNLRCSWDVSISLVFELPELPIYLSLSVFWP